MELISKVAYSLKNMFRFYRIGEKLLMVEFFSGVYRLYLYQAEHWTPFFERSEISRIKVILPSTNETVVAIQEKDLAGAITIRHVDFEGHVLLAEHLGKDGVDFYSCGTSVFRLFQNHLCYSENGGLTTAMKQDAANKVGSFLAGAV